MCDLSDLLKYVLHVLLLFFVTYIGGLPLFVGVYHLYFFLEEATRS